MIRNCNVFLRLGIDDDTYEARNPQSIIAKNKATPD